MDFVVIGGTGMVGTAVATALRARGHEVRPASRANGFDLARPTTWPSAFAGARRALYLTPRTVERPAEVGGAVFAALARAGVERVVNLTGLGVERAVGSPLFALERALEQSGLGFTHVRPNYIMQNLCTDPARRDLVERDELAVAAGDARISWVDVRDVAEVCAAALVRDDLAGRALDLTGPAALTYTTFAEALTRATGRTIRYVALTPDEARAKLLAEGVPADRVDGRLALLALARAGAFSQVSAHVAEVLGRPATSAEDFTRTHAHRWARET